MRRCMGTSGYHPPYDIFALRLISSILEEMELALVLKSASFKDKQTVLHTVLLRLAIFKDKSASKAKYKIFRLQDSTIPTPLRLIVGLKQ